MPFRNILAVAALAGVLLVAACDKKPDSATTASASIPPVAGASAAPGAPTNWLDTVVATPQGGFRQGNPDAKVKLLEFGSLTCSHCGAFAHEGVPELRAKYIATGKVSYEYRPFLLNGVDFAPSLLVRCQSAGGGAQADRRLLRQSGDVDAAVHQATARRRPEEARRAARERAGHRVCRAGRPRRLHADAWHDAGDSSTSARATRPASPSSTRFRDDANKNYALTAHADLRSSTARR